MGNLFQVQFARLEPFFRKAARICRGSTGPTVAAAIDLAGKIGAGVIRRPGLCVLRPSGLPRRRQLERGDRRQSAANSARHRSSAGKEAEGSKIDHLKWLYVSTSFLDQLDEPECSIAELPNPFVRR